MSVPFESREAALLVNTRSLKGSEWLSTAQMQLADAGFNLPVSEGFTKAGDLFARLKSLASEERLVIVGGGDGTLSGAANILAKTRVTMGVLPLGTGNAFARDLGIPTDVEKAVEIIAGGRTANVDLGVCNDRLFLNVVTIGLTTTVAKTLTGPLKRRFGRLVYAVAVIKALREMKPFVARIETENGRTEVEAVQLVLGNGRYHGGPLPVSPGAAITSGSLHLYTVSAGSKADLLKYALLLPTGFQGILKAVHAEDTTGGRITAEPGQAVVVDGEVSERTPLAFNVRHAALRVMVPESFAG